MVAFLFVLVIDTCATAEEEARGVDVDDARAAEVVSVLLYESGPTAGSPRYHRMDDVITTHVCVSVISLRAAALEVGAVWMDHVKLA